jgi:hypothetical protein
MSKKNVLTLLAFNAVVNAILVNMKVLHAIHLNWWFVFLPTWFSMVVIISKIAKDVLRHRRVPIKR